MSGGGIQATTPVITPVITPEPAPGVVTLPGQRLADAVSAFTHQVTDRWSSPVLMAAAAVVVLMAMLAWQTGRARLHRWRHQRLAVNARQVLISPPPEVDPAGAGLWWANVAGLLRPTRWKRLLYGTPHLGIEYRWTGRQLRIVVWVPGTVAAGPVADAVRAAWPGAATVIEDAEPPVPSATRAPSSPTPESGATAPTVPTVRESGGALVPMLPAWYPSGTVADHGVDPLRALISAGSSLRTGEAACVQILAHPAPPHAVARARAGATTLKTGQPSSRGFGPERLLGAIAGGLLDVVTPVSGRSARPTRSSTAATRTGTGTSADPLRERDARPGLDKVAEPLWEVALRYAVTHTQNTTRTVPLDGQRPPGRVGRGGKDDVVGRRLATLAHGVASAMAVHDGRNRYRRMRSPHPTRVLASRAMRSGFLLSAGELAALAGLPTDIAVPGLDRARAKTAPAPVAVPGGGRGTKVLGRALAGGHSVALPVVDAREHLHVLGSTGVGKSTFLTHLALADVKAGRGMVLIDPKGDLALDVLTRLPESALDRLVLIDPDQRVGSAWFNPLQLRAGMDADLIADNLVAIFAAIFQRHWGPRIDDVLRVSCLSLMRNPNPTLLNVPPLLNDKQFRSQMTVGFDDPAGLRGFWEWYETTPANLRAQVIGPVLARLRAFLLRSFVRDTIGDANSSFDMRRVIDGGGILIARLPKGQLGEDTSRLLGSMIFASVWQAATMRARLPEPTRRDAAVYIDEAHNVLNLSGSVSDMLAEARGYHLSLTLAHQHLGQLPRETQLDLSANARNKIYFNCSPEDAHQLARHTLPDLDEHDLNHLDAYTAAARLSVANRETSAFTLATLPPPPATADLDRVREAVADRAPTRRPRDSDDDASDEDAGAQGSKAETPATRDGGGRAVQPLRDPSETRTRSQPSAGNPTRTKPQVGGPA